MTSRKMSARSKLVRYGAIIGIVGTVLVLLLPGLFEAGIRSQIKLVKGGEMYKNWLNVPLAVTTKFHFFAILNREQAMAGQRSGCERSARLRSSKFTSIKELCISNHLTFVPTDSGVERR